MGIDNRAWGGVIERVRRTATHKGHTRSGVFAIEGIRLHERALRGGASLEEVVVGKGFADDPNPRVKQLLQDLAHAGYAPTRVPDEVIATLTEGRRLGDIVGLVRLPPQPNLAQVTAVPENGRCVLLAALDVVDPGNVGALLRSAHAAGAAGFIAVGASDPYHPRAVRTSMGSLFKLPVWQYASAAALLDDLRAFDVETLGTAVADGISLPHLQLHSQRVAILMGNEAFGLPPAILQAIDRRVTIPMHDGIDSFSVNAAAAIILYELMREYWR